MALDTEKIIEDLKGATILELNDLVKAIEYFRKVIPKWWAGWIRVTHPCAGRRPSKASFRCRFPSTCMC